MPVGDRQNFIKAFLGQVLGELPQNRTFDWFINKHREEHFGMDFQHIDHIFNSLGGSIIANQNKRTYPLRSDAYFGGEYNFLFEFDELQHFNTPRLTALELLPGDIKANYNIDDWIALCKKHKSKADRYRKSKTAVDFDFPGGRTAQRAYLDCFRDFLPIKHNLNPTLRINIFEVADINSNGMDDFRRLEKLLKSKL
jgi:hypothetical protein